jgi:CRISPR-associated protein Cas2
MPTPSIHLISYDIEDDRERLQVSKVLEGFGRRVQKSVFECPLTKGKKHQLEKMLENLELDTGYVLIYRLDEKSKRTALGQVPADLAREEPHAFII